MSNREMERRSASRRLSLDAVRIADVALVLYMVCITVFSSGSLLVQAARVLLVCGAITELKRERYRVGKFELWQLLFVAYVCASIFWAFDPDGAKSIASTVVINAVCVVCIVFILRSNPKRISLLLVCIVVAPIFLMLNVALTDGLLAFSDSRSTDSFSANTVGMTAAFGACLAGYCFFEGRLLGRSLCLLLVAVDLTIVVLSASRKAIMMVVLAFAIYMLLKSRGDGVKATTRLAAVLFVVLVCFFAVMNIPFLYDMVGYRIETMISGFLGEGNIDASTSTRMTLIEHGIEFFWMSPAIGHGGANFSALDAAYYSANSGYYAHNNFIEILTDYGLIGFMLYYWMYALMIVASLKNIKRLSSFQLIVLALLLVLLVMEYGFVSYYERFFQVFLAFAYCVLIVCPVGFELRSKVGESIKDTSTRNDCGGVLL